MKTKQKGSRKEPFLFQSANKGVWHFNDRDDVETQ